MKYEIIGDTSIIIDLHNGYSILAMGRWNKEYKLYDTTLYIKKNDIDRFDLIDLTFSVETDNKKELCMKILKYVENTDFTYYVNRTKYELDCFERGNALYEREKLNVK